MGRTIKRCGAMTRPVTLDVVLNKIGPLSLGQQTMCVGVHLRSQALTPLRDGDETYAVEDGLVGDEGARREFERGDQAGRLILAAPTPLPVVAESARREEHIGKVP